MDDNMKNDPTRDDLLILVDGLDKETGSATKWDAHVRGQLHRAFSVVLVRSGAQGPELLVARRAQEKYHSAGLWANSCCSHPRVGEEVLDAAYRRVTEELGCEARDLRELTAFAYRAEFENGLCEYEYDHVLIGQFAGELALNPSEVDDVRWMTTDELAAELSSKPEIFAAWAPMVFSMVMAELAKA